MKEQDKEKKEVMAKWEVEEGVCNLIVSKDGVLVSSSEVADEIDRKLNAFDGMLQALKWCVNHLQQIEKRDYPGVEEKQRRFSSTATGLAAIAKAEGSKFI